MSHTIAIILGVMVSTLAFAVNMILQRQSNGLSGWSGWLGATAVRTFGLFVSLVVLYLYLKKADLVETQSASTYIILLATILLGMMSDLVLSLMKIKKKEKVQ